MFFATVAGIVVITVVGVILFSSKTSIKSPLIPPTTSESKIEGTKNYADESGFSFDYPENLTIKDATPDDYYSLLELNGSGGGKLTITVKDTDVQTIDEWFDKDGDAPKTATVAGATSLGNLSAKQYSFSRGADKLLLTIAIDQGIVYLVESPVSAFWEEAQTIIVSSFKIGEIPPSSGSAGSGGSGAIYEEEEIVE